MESFSYNITVMFTLGNLWWILILQNKMASFFWTANTTQKDELTKLMLTNDASKLLQREVSQAFWYIYFGVSRMNPNPNVIQNYDVGCCWVEKRVSDNNMQYILTKYVTLLLCVCWVDFLNNLLWFKKNENSISQVKKQLQCYFTLHNRDRALSPFKSILFCQILIHES